MKEGDQKFPITKIHRLGDSVYFYVDVPWCRTEKVIVKSAKPKLMQTIIKQYFLENNGMYHKKTFDSCVLKNGGVINNYQPSTNYITP